jgi:uncharacterized glyoxalase superfamily protein PhnB
VDLAQIGATRQARRMSDAPPPSVWPTTHAADARALIHFLIDAFGFELTAMYADGDVVHHAELVWPLGGGIMLGSAREGSDVRQPGQMSVYVVTEDPDALCERARAAGAEITTELHDTDYGSRDFAARDPEGNSYSFGTYRGEPRA